MEENRSLIYSLRFNFIYVDVYSFTRMWIYPTTVLPYGLLRYILAGEGEFVLDGRRHNVKPNQVVYIPQGTTLDCKAFTDDFKFMSIRFVTTIQLKNNDFLSNYFNVLDVTEAEDERVLSYFREIYETASFNKSIGKMFKIRGYLELIIAWLTERGEKRQQSQLELNSTAYTIEKLQQRARKSGNVSRDPRIQAVEDYIVAHPKDPLDLKLLCSIAEVSESSLRRLFKIQTGKSPGDYIKELRMLTASRELLASERRISDIAYDLGYNDPNYFTRTFHSVFGISPQEYRKVSREGSTVEFKRK